MQGAGAITFRPIEANLTHNTDLIGKMNPYCAFIVGDQIFKSSVCKKGGKHPHWEDQVSIPVGNVQQIIVEIMDKDRFSRDDNIGSFVINLAELQATGGNSRWYPLTYKNKPAGEVLMEVYMSGSGMTGMTSGATTGVTTTEVIVEQPVVVEQVTSTTVPVENRHVWQEQQQVVEARTFMKEVDVVETRAAVQNIEVLEPRLVTKDVQYTQAVPVTKQIEVSEPQVVVKEVEVIEPRLVTKTIQVVENVPVVKQVEVIESVPRVQEVTTYEPQTFTKQVEVTDYVPVTKQVTVTEPVHLKKAVEFVEPVITTQTITKSEMPAVIVDEQITTTVGPATLVGETAVYSTGMTTLTQEQQLWSQTEWTRLTSTGIAHAEAEKEFQRLWLTRWPGTTYSCNHHHHLFGNHHKHM